MAEFGVRQLRPSELPLFREHLLRLDASSRRDRFNGPAGDAFVSAYAERCFRDGTSVIGYLEEGRVLGAAEIHEFATADAPTGEIAFSVEHQAQHRGVGSALFARLIEIARLYGYSRLLVTTHPQNEAMKRLARRFDARLSFAEGETVGTIELPPLESALPHRFAAA